MIDLATESLSTELPAPLETQIRELMQRICDAELTVAVAESCTGGLLASLLTDIPGVSHGFEAGFVVYSDAAKKSMLGIPADVLEEEGAVSRQTAVLMAEAALARADVDLTVSITGYAGPSGESEAGLVHFGCAGAGQATNHSECHFGDIGRAAVRLAAVRVAIEMLETMAKRLTGGAAAS